jgi:hypothetical protein
MKKLVLSLAVLTLFSFKLADVSLTADERKFAAEQLTKSRDLVLKTVKGLSPAQLNYKPTPESWSVAECAEHIAISEGNIWGMVDGALKPAADPSRRAEVKMSDDAVINAITDRTHKVKTGEAFVPSGKFGSIDGILKEFNAKRKSHFDYMNTTQDDLRNHYAQTPFGTMDAFQVVLFMSGHCERHTKQMQEVMADANFPKK